MCTYEWWGVLVCGLMISETYYILRYWALTECANVTQNEWDKTCKTVSKLKIRMLTHSYPKLSFGSEISSFVSPGYWRQLFYDANEFSILFSKNSSSAWDH